MTKSENPLPKPSSITGFTDYSEQEHFEINRWKTIVNTTFEEFGFTRFSLRPVEKKEHLMKGGIGNQVYALARFDGTGSIKLGLPYDHTVPFALWVAQRVGAITFPLKRSDLELSFRGERAQAGRFRGFIQADIDIIDRNMSILSDYECIKCIINTLSRLNVGAFTLSINHMSIATGLINSFEIPKEKFADVCISIDKLDKCSASEIVTDIVEKLDEYQITKKQIENLIDSFLFEGSLEEFSNKFAHHHPLIQAGVTELKNLYNLLISTKINPDLFQFKPRIIRGLNYYTGVVFESHLVGKESIGSIASGGRYSNLIGEFNQSCLDINGVGASIGLTRLFDIMITRSNQELKRKSIANCMVAYEKKEDIPKAIKLAEELRQHGLKVDLYTGENTKLKKELSYADKKGIPCCFILLEDQILLKYFKSNSQVEISQINDSIISSILKEDAY
ncbi:MAG: HisS family protein [Rhabdochlamydiaceae bacterium]|nr:HisS family protein [Candidatus Amphrikana amoebophyrae]